MVTLSLVAYTVKGLCPFSTTLIEMLGYRIYIEAQCFNTSVFRQTVIVVLFKFKFRLVSDSKQYVKRSVCGLKQHC